MSSLPHSPIASPTLPSIKQSVSECDFRCQSHKTRKLSEQKGHFPLSAPAYPVFSVFQVASGEHLGEGDGQKRWGLQKTSHTVTDTITVHSKPSAALWGWVETEQQAQLLGYLRHPHSTAHYFWTWPSERRAETHTIGISACEMRPLCLSYCTPIETTALPPPIKTFAGQLMSQPGFKGRREKAGLACLGKNFKRIRSSHH